MSSFTDSYQRLCLIYRYYGKFMLDWFVITSYLRLLLLFLTSLSELCIVLAFLSHGQSEEVVRIYQGSSAALKSALFPLFHFPSPSFHLFQTYMKLREEYNNIVNASDLLVVNNMPHFLSLDMYIHTNTLALFFFLPNHLKVRWKHRDTSLLTTSSCISYELGRTLTSITIMSLAYPNNLTLV